jgi:hypothetical protein
MKELSPTKQVEAHLRAEYLNNKERKIWPSNNAVIDRMLADSKNMVSVYDELFRICPRGYRAGSTWECWQYVINGIVETAAGWSPKKMESVRDALKEIRGADGVKGLNKSIQEKALELASLLRKRDQLCELNSLARPDDYHPLDLIEPATKIADEHDKRQTTHYLYTSWIKESLDALRSRFGLKYWPRTADMLEAMAGMQDIEPVPCDTLDAAALKSRQASDRDFLRALEAAMQDDHFRIGKAIKFSDTSLAAIANCVLGLDGEIEPGTIKKFRADERKRNR